MAEDLLGSYLVKRETPKSFPKSIGFEGERVHIGSDHTRVVNEMLPLEMGSVQLRYKYNERSD